MQIKDYLWYKEFGSYIAFLKILETYEYKEFKSIMNTFQNYIDKSMVAMENPDATVRNRQLNEFGEWMAESKKDNPVQI